MEPANEHSIEHQPISTSAKPIGEVMYPAIICGAVGAGLTIILSVIGRYVGVDLALKEYYMGAPFYMPETSAWHVAWDWLIVLVLTFGVSFTVLDTDKKWRRVMIMLLLIVVVLLSSPSLMLWDVFWSPMMVVVGVLWSWICAFTYSCQHTMPCELLLPAKKLKTSVTNITPQDISENVAELVEDKPAVDVEFKPKKPSSCPD